MGNTYRALSPAATAAFAEGVFEAAFSPPDEQDHLSSGLIEIVPRPYRVLSNNYSAGKQGDVVNLALVVEEEAALIQGGHIERASQPSNKKKG